MKQISFLVLWLYIFIISCSNDPQKLLDETRTKMLGYEDIKYDQISLYQNPMGTFDTTKTSVLWKKNEDDYDYITRKGQIEMVGLDGDYKSINHTNKTVHLEQEDRINPKYSPLNFLKQDDWKFASDTVIDGTKMSDFYQVKYDTVIDNNKIYTDLHIFIDPYSRLLRRFERRSYQNGKPVQKIIYKYSDYGFDKIEGKLTYDLPPDYRTVPKGVASSKIALQEGEEAPNFSVKDLKDRSFELQGHRGEKVLLMFSIIRCSYCQLALEHLNQEDYELSDKVTALYINPAEKQKDVIDYTNRVMIPFPVISNAKEVGDTYGVAGFPCFFLIDEKGKIEKIVYGYNKEFLDSLKSA